MLAFEAILRVAEEIPCPADDNIRKVTWLDDSHVLGLARQNTGAFELFISGDKLYAGSSLVKRHLQYDKWERADGIAFQANRVVLPSPEHYVAIAAFLAEELLRRDVVESPERAFRQTEPIIEIALQRLALGEEQILGLLGELRFLDVLLSIADSDHERVQVLASWRGFERGSRDFVFGPCAVEVKTTRGETSFHHVASVRQVDPDRSATNQPVEELFLLSLGFAAIESGASNPRGISLSSQVDVILLKLDAPGAATSLRTQLQTLFLDKVSQYGASGSDSYVRDEMKHWPMYRGLWEHQFVRIYDMNDEAIRVLRKHDVERCSHVVGESVSFDILLPHQISGELNPQHDLYPLARKCIRGSA